MEEGTRWREAVYLGHCITRCSTSWPAAPATEGRYAEGKKVTAGARDYSLMCHPHNGLAEKEVIPKSFFGKCLVMIVKEENLRLHLLPLAHSRLCKATSMHMVSPEDALGATALTRTAILSQVRNPASHAVNASCKQCATQICIPVIGVNATRPEWSKQLLNTLRASAASLTKPAFFHVDCHKARFG